RGAAFALSNASKRARIRSIGSRSRGSLLIFRSSPAVAPPGSPLPATKPADGRSTPPSSTASSRRSKSQPTTPPRSNAMPPRINWLLSYAPSLQTYGKIDPTAERSPPTENRRPTAPCLPRNDRHPTTNRQTPPPACAAPGDGCARRGDPPSIVAYKRHAEH